MRKKYAESLSRDHLKDAIYANNAKYAKYANN